MHNPAGTRARVRLGATLAGILPGTVYGALAATLPEVAHLALLVSVPAGALFGTLLAVGLAHVFGRRTLSVLSGLLVCAGAVCPLVPLAFLGVVLGGALAGTGAGMICVTTSLLSGELSATNRETPATDITSYFPLGVGALLVIVVVGDALAVPPATTAWSVVAALSVVVSAVHLTMPESPAWLACHRSIEDAHACLVRMYGTLEAGLELDWVLMSADMAREQRRLRRSDLALPGVLRTVTVGLVLSLSIEAPFGLAALVLVPSIVTVRAPGRPGVLASLVTGLICIAVTLITVGQTQGRSSYVRVLSGLSLGVLGLGLLALVPHTSGTPALLLSLTVVGVLAWAQFGIGAPAVRGVIDPSVPPWLIRAQSDAGLIASAVARLFALALPGVLLGLGDLGRAATILVLVELGALMVVTVGLPQALRHSS